MKNAAEQRFSFTLVRETQPAASPPAASFLPPGRRKSGEYVRFAHIRPAGSVFEDELASRR
jgi:hypothetical protein